MSEKEGSFVVVTRGRTGSTALASMLDAISQVRCWDELLATYCTWDDIPSRPFGKPLSQDKVCLAYHHYSDSMSVESYGAKLRESVGTQQTTIGFKALPHQLDEWPAFHSFIRGSFDIIFLTRDPACSAVSAHYALQTKTWNYYNKSKGDYLSLLAERQASSITLDADEVVREAGYARDWQTDFSKEIGTYAKRGRRVLHVNYEDIFSEHSDSTPSILKLKEYFGVHSILQTSNVRRILVDRPSQIENMPEIVAKLQAAGFETNLLKG